MSLPGCTFTAVFATARRPWISPINSWPLLCAPWPHPHKATFALAAQAELEALDGELNKTHPGAAAGLREGPPSTLTVLCLGVPPTSAMAAFLRRCRATDTTRARLRALDVAERPASVLGLVTW